MKYGNRIRTIREEARLSMEQLADLVGVTFGTIYNWEKDITQPAGKNKHALENVLQKLSGAPEEQDELLDTLKKDVESFDSDSRLHNLEKQVEELKGVVALLQKVVLNKT